jgi:hypothetical protein
MRLKAGGRIALVTDAFQLAPLTFPGTASVNALTDAFIGAFDNAVSSDWVFLGAIARFGPTPTGPTFEVARFVQGLSTPAPLTPNTAVLVQKRTILGGRSNRGRFYVPGLPEDSVDGSGSILLTPLTALQAGANNYLAAAQAAPEVENLVVLHDQLVVGPPTPVTSLQVQTLVGTQRRRLR